ncbi:MAG: hypothetical protein Kow0099_36660 [Candidatus Abyssubacteria bacterium]
MLPTTFEFRWDTGHMIFFGLFYAVVAVVVTSLFFVVAKSVTDVYRTLKYEPQSISTTESESTQQTRDASET